MEPLGGCYTCSQQEFPDLQKKNCVTKYSERILVASNFGLPSNDYSFEQRNEYLWSNYEVELPFKIDF